MSYSVKIYGAGSIVIIMQTNMLGGLAVSIYDKDQSLLRTKKLIYPSRYGKWNKIKLYLKTTINFMI